MAVIDIPKQGLELLGAPFVKNPSSTSEPPPNTRQVMLLDLPGGFLDEILTNARSGGKDTLVTLGKAPALTIKGKQHIVHVTPNNNVLQLLYSITKRSSPPSQKTMQCEGFIAKHIRLGNIKIEETDPALLALQRSLADAEKKKQSNTTIFVKDASKLPPAKSGKHPVAKANAGPLAFLRKSQQPGIFDHRNATTRSMPASPSLTAVTPPRARPDEKMLKAEAMKTALIHLLAVRPLSERFICTTLGCTAEEIKDLIRRFGREFPIDKLVLSDKGYQLLDVWKFRYPTQDDRQAAIDRAVKAFDRQRLSREENAWQLLLPKKERGKGKILSNLWLHDGPVQYRVRTPRINVQDADDTKKGGDATGTDDTGTDREKRKGRLAPSNTQPSARSRSQDPIKKQRVSEKEAQSRRLLSKNPKKAIQSVITKGSKANAKKEAKKASTIDVAKVKSAEFVRDSDEDAEMEDAINVETTKVNSRHTSKVSKPSADVSTAKKDTVLPKVATKTERLGPKRPVAHKTLPQKTSNPIAKADPEKKPASSNSSGSGSINRLSDTSQTSTGMRRTISHKRTTSSPIKPSPLGSSPPANASDFDNETATPQGSSSSASPLAKIRREAQVVKTNDVARSISDRSTHRPERGDSDRGLKRKANDIDSDIHDHGDAKVSNGIEPPAKRQQNYPDSPPTSDSSSSAASPGISSSIIPLAQEFKTYYQTYQTAHREIADMVEPPQDKVEKVMRMHQRLEEMKTEITKAVGS
ncbi:hypothetical protein MMC11_001546 [Xylographa trunciseda]|nr:hypothetical protein [Xylographa trunciseda]